MPPDGACRRAPSGPYVRFRPVSGGLDVLLEPWHGGDVEIRFPTEPLPYQRRLIEALGCRVVVDPEAPYPGCQDCRPTQGSRSDVMPAAIAAHDVLRTRLCPIAGCPNEQPCRDHPDAGLAPRTVLKPKEDAAVARIDVPVKRKPVCVNHPDREAPNRGRYAYKCAECRQQQPPTPATPPPKPTIDPATVAGGHDRKPPLGGAVAKVPIRERPPLTPSRPVPKITLPSGEGYASKVAVVAKAAADVDAAVAASDVAERNLEGALLTFHELVEQLKDA